MLPHTQLHGAATTQPGSSQVDVNWNSTAKVQHTQALPESRSGIGLALFFMKKTVNNLFQLPFFFFCFRFHLPFPFRSPSYSPSCSISFPPPLPLSLKILWERESTKMSGWEAGTAMVWWREKLKGERNRNGNGSWCKKSFLHFLYSIYPRSMVQFYHHVVIAT